MYHFMLKTHTSEIVANDISVK